MAAAALSSHERYDPDVPELYVGMQIASAAASHQRAALSSAACLSSSIGSRLIHSRIAE